MFDLNSFKLKSLQSFHQEHSLDSWYDKALSDCIDGLWDWDIANNHLYISEKFQELIGYTDEEVKKLSYDGWVGRIHPEDRAEIQDQMEKLTHSQNEFASFNAFRFQCKNNDYIWIKIRGKILYNQDNKIIRMAGIIINLTSQKTIQNHLYQIIAEQEKEAQRKIRFLSALNHEFRSPLSGVLGMATLLKETSLSAEQLHYADNISHSTEMLLTLVNDILDVSKISSGKFEFEKIRFSPNQILKSASDLVRPSLLKKDLAFNTFISGHIPEYLMGDPTRLQQILVNLLSNASKFTSKGSINLTVKKEASSQSLESQGTHILHFEISDTGIGISPEVQETLFKDFIQANSSITRMYGGTGLGLSICKELVQLMGGEIGVKSALNKGSTFWFTLPFEEAEVASALETHADLVLGEPQKQRRLDILLVEDNQVNQEVMCGLLGLLGDEVTVANNGKEAIELFLTKKFDIILMDLNMPVLDGLGATQAIRTLPHGDIPIIAVTASLFTEDQENCHQHGITHVLTKPINKIRLEQALEIYRSPINKNQPSAFLKEGAFDQNTLKTLMHDLGTEKAIRLLDIYRQEGLALVTQIKDSPPQASKDYAHKLAGMSENLGIQGVGKAARNIIEASQYSYENLPILIQELERHFEVSLSEIQNIVLTSNRN